MNRRSFLSGLAAIAAGATLDPERALWKPGKLISIPKRNEILTPEILSRAILEMLRSKGLACDGYWPIYPHQAKVGDVMRIVRTPRFVGRRAGRAVFAEPPPIVATICPGGLHFHKAGA